VVELVKEIYVREPGLVVVDIAATDDATVFKLQEALARL
jgi:hypothetical protein